MYLRTKNITIKPHSRVVMKFLCQ